MDLRPIREAIQQRLHLHGIRCSAHIPDNPNPPVVVVQPDSVEYRVTFDHHSDVTFVLVLIAGSISDQAAQDQLDRWVSTEDGSVVAALEEDSTLGGEVSSSHVASMRNYGTIEVPPNSGRRYFAAELVVEVYP